MSREADLFKQALEFHQSGNLEQAEPLCREVLQINPIHSEALHLWGMIAFQAGRPDLAAASIQQAIDVIPWSAVFHSNLGLAQETQGKIADALASYRQALQLQPDFADAHNHLANLLQKQGQLPEALEHARKAVEFRPTFAVAHNNFARALYATGSREQAEVHFRRAVELQPDFAQAHSNLGVVLSERNCLEEAIEQYREALRLNPKYFEAHNNLGNALGLQRKLDEAVASFRSALRINPSFAEAHANLGAALLLKGKLDEAVSACRQAIALQPSYAEAHNNLGGALLDQGNLPDAVAAFKNALALQPGNTSAHSNLLFCMNYDPQADPDEVFAEHCRWGRQQPSSPLPAVTRRNDGTRLRIGYVSPDFRQHPLSRYIEPVLANHDPEKVEITCYAEVSYPDAVTARLQKHAHHWRPIRGLSASDAAQQIRDDGIDILVDLAGHTAGNRLDVFALKPAAVQATWLGYLNTTGLSTVDYRLTDAVLDSPDQPKRDTEELLRLPHGFCCFAPPVDAPDVGPLPVLKRGHLTFGSLHNLFKLNSAVFDLWSQVLRTLPTSRLLMYRDTLHGAALERIVREFGQRGITRQRLELRSAPKDSNHLQVYADIDVSLDAFPWTGGVTTCESLWMGVPVLSLAGVRPPARNSASILTQAGLNDFVCKTSADFLARAVRLPKELDGLAQLRQKLRDRMTTTLCDARRFTGELEAAYRTMWAACSLTTESEDES